LGSGEDDRTSATTPNKQIIIEYDPMGGGDGLTDIYRIKIERLNEETGDLKVLKAIMLIEQEGTLKTGDRRRKVDDN